MPEFDSCVFARVILGVTFLVSGAIHALRLRAFKLTVIRYAVLPPRLSESYAAVVAPVEVMIGLSLLAGVAVTPVALIAGGLLLTFLAGVTVNLARGRDIDCGCFGEGERIGITTLGRIGVLAAVDTALVFGLCSAAVSLEVSVASAAMAGFVLTAAYLWRQRGTLSSAFNDVIARRSHRHVHGATENSGGA